MHELLNVLYVQTQGALLRLDHDALRVGPSTRAANRPRRSPASPAS